MHPVAEDGTAEDGFLDLTSLSHLAVLLAASSHGTLMGRRHCPLAMCRMQGREEDKDMATGPDHKAAFVAFSRFSFGARGGAYAGDLARAASDPRGFLRAELLQPAIARLDAPALPQTKV